MVLKRHEDKPWEWIDNKCFLQHHGQAECDGVMELKDVKLKGRRSKESPLGPGAPKPFSLYLEKIWVCNKCGFVFEE